VNWSQVAPDRFQRQVVVNTVTNLVVPQKGLTFLNSCETLSFSRRCLSTSQLHSYTSMEVETKASKIQVLKPLMYKNQKQRLWERVSRRIRTEATCVRSLLRLAEYRATNTALQLDSSRCSKPASGALYCPAAASRKAWVCPLLVTDVFVTDANREAWRDEI
jgi:hypothetical protein